jgi:hypothetical protein
LLFHHDLRMRDHGGERFDVRIVLVVAKLHRRLRRASPTAAAARGSIE